MKNYLIVLTGPTGVGKTDLSIEIAQHFNTEIVSCDSRQFFKEMRIGTAVPSEDQLNKVKHYFIGNRSVNEYFNVSKYEFETIDLLKNLFKDRNIVILAGGSMLYIDAVCKGIDDLPDIDLDLRNKLIKRADEEGVESLRFELKRLDPEYYKVVDLKNKNRILRALEVCLQTGKTFTSFRTRQTKDRDFEVIKICLDRVRAELYARINKRVLSMISNGLEAEARGLYKYRGMNALKTVGYRELFDYFDGKYSLERAVELIQNNSRKYARRQLTWFRRDPEVNWFHPDQKKRIIQFIEEKMS